MCKESKMYKSQIDRGFGWVTIAESDSFISARNIANDYAIEHDCDWRVVHPNGEARW